jgi:hypothetical protein
MATLGQQQYTCDRAATLEAYARFTVAESNQCTCLGCRNFRLARSKAFPQPFLALLDTLGIDPTKEGEIYHLARGSPGIHMYGGWFHFVGSLEVAGDVPAVRMSDNFSVWMERYSGAPRIESLSGLPLVQLEILADAVPWCLPEEELE